MHNDCKHMCTTRCAAIPCHRMRMVRCCIPRSHATFPDIATTGADQYTYWWYSNFTVQSTAATENAHYWLHLHGVHYEANVFLNGYEISPNTGRTAHVCEWTCHMRSCHVVQQDETGMLMSCHVPIFLFPGDSTARGMFRRYTYAITSLLSHTAPNELAMLISPPPQLGSAAKGGQGGDHQYARNGPVAQFMLGWDWIQGTGSCVMTSVRCTSCHLRQRTCCFLDVACPCCMCHPNR